MAFGAYGHALTSPQACPYDRDHPFATIHRLSNSFRVVPATAASVPVEAMVFEASN
jgi:hypothetical protein